MRKPLDKTLRGKLEKTVEKARDTVEIAVTEALTRLGIGDGNAPNYLSEVERKLRTRLRAHGRQLGDVLNRDTGKQETELLVNEMAYEHWHRMLFARFLEQSDLLMYDQNTHVSLDECFESLTLIQTGKTKPRPIILVDSPDSEYWKRLIDFVTGELSEGGFISSNDLSLLIRVNSIEQAADEILQFYRIYHSIRYVGDKTIIRLNLPLSSEDIDKLNKKYSGILRSGKIESTDPLPVEQKREELLDLPRLVMDFNRHDFGIFHEMLHFLNKLGTS